MEQIISQWIVYKLPLPIGVLLVKILRNFLAFPHIQMKLLPPNTIQDGENIYKYYSIHVKNVGNSTAKSCWPRLLRTNDPTFIPQAISWGADFDIPPPNIQKFDLKPNDTNHFTLAWTSQRESEDNLIVGNVTLARRKGVNHYLWLFQPGEQVIEVDIVGDNFRAKSRKYKVALTDSGSRAWQTLEVKSYPNPIIRSISKMGKKIKGLTKEQSHKLLNKASQPIKKSGERKILNIGISALRWL